MNVISEARRELTSRYIRSLLSIPGDMKFNFNKYLIFDEAENYNKKINCRVQFFMILHFKLIKYGRNNLHEKWSLVLLTNKGM